MGELVSTANTDGFRCFVGVHGAAFAAADAVVVVVVVVVASAWRTEITLEGN